MNTANGAQRSSGADAPPRACVTRQWLPLFATLPAFAHPHLHLCSHPHLRPHHSPLTTHHSPLNPHPSPLTPHPSPPTTRVKVTEPVPLTVSVTNAEGEKCERCWKYSEDVGESKEYPAVCNRCAKSLTLMGFKYFPPVKDEEPAVPA